MDDSTTGPADDPRLVTPETMAAAPPLDPDDSPASERGALRRFGMPIAIVAAGLVGGALVGGIATASASAPAAEVGTSVAGAGDLRDGAQPGGQDDDGSGRDGDHAGRGGDHGPGGLPGQAPGTSAGGTESSGTAQPSSHGSTGASG